MYGPRPLPRGVPPDVGKHCVARGTWSRGLWFGLSAASTVRLSLRLAGKATSHTYDYEHPGQAPRSGHAGLSKAQRRGTARTYYIRVKWTKQA